MDMDNQPSTAPFPTSQKRVLEDDLPTICTPKKDGVSSEASTPLTVLSVATPSPFKNATPQASAPPSSNPIANNGTPAATANDTQPAKKRRKFTDKEKEEQRLEKEAKAKARADQKAQKEEEKRAKEEDLRKKKDEREEKKRAKELEQQQKEEKKKARELEQQQKEEEKRKKERSQMSLSAFFAKPKAGAGDSSGTTVVESTQKPAPEPISLAPDVPMQDANPGPVSPQKAIQRAAKSDYERYFLPFEPPSHVIMAPHNRYMEDPAKLASAQARLDEVLSQENVTMDPIDIHTFKSRFASCKARGKRIPSMVDIVERINNSSDYPIDLTKEDENDPMTLLRQIPMKYLHFPEDVRPPYYGTYTKSHTPRETAKLARNPFSRILHLADYDYDSEAEWEEPEEGEDLDSEGEEDLDEEGEDDLDGFLDDEEDAQVKRRLISGDLEPITTGLCWQGPDGVSRLNDGSGAISTAFKGFEMGFLLETQSKAIDPFSTAYWAPPPTAVTSTTIDTKQATIAGAMQPPRLPLVQRPMNSMLNGLNAVHTNAVAGTTKSGKPKRMVPAEQLSEFKAEVEGSDLTKIALIEALKKKFPKLPKDAISNTLSAVAARVGPKEVEKRWVLL